MAFMVSPLGTCSSSRSPRGVFGSVCVITMLLFLTLPGHVSCPATFPMQRILLSSGIINYNSVLLHSNVSHILLSDFRSYIFLCLVLRELRREGVFHSSDRADTRSV